MTDWLGTPRRPAVVSQWFSLRHLAKFYSQIDKRRNGDIQNFSHRSERQALIRVTRRECERLFLDMTPAARALMVEDALYERHNGRSVRDRLEAESAYFYLTGTKPVLLDLPVKPE